MPSLHQYGFHSERLNNIIYVGFQLHCDLEVHRLSQSNVASVLIRVIAIGPHTSLSITRLSNFYHLLERQ